MKSVHLLFACALLPGAGTGCSQIFSSSSSSKEADATPVDATPVDADLTDAAPLALANCQEILFEGRSNGDGTYEIDPDGLGGEPPFSVYCDMSTRGGGWTLVYAYGFTDYANFAAPQNAVTPRPSWTFTLPANESAPVSTTAPTGLDNHAALEFKRWKEIGTTFLVQSNINHSLECTEGTGSLVREESGTVNCMIVDKVEVLCGTVGVAPTGVAKTSSGARLVGAAGNYYYWDGSLTDYFPTHDPCGTNSANQLNVVEEPSGAIFLRP